MILQHINCTINNHLDDYRAKLFIGKMFERYQENMDAFTFLQIKSIVADYLDDGCIHIYEQICYFINLLYIMLIMLTYKPHFFNYLDIEGDAQE